MAKYIARHSVAHGRNADNSPRIYAPGEEMELDPSVEAEAKVIAALRKANAIALPNELEAPEDVAARQARLEAELAAAKAEVEQMRAEKAAAAAAAKSGGKGAAAKGAAGDNTEDATGGDK